MSIVTLIEHNGGEVTRAALEAVTAARSLAEHSGARTTAILLADAASAEVAREQLASLPFETLHIVVAESLATYTPDLYADGIAEVLSGSEPELVVLPHTYRSVDLIGLLAHRLGAGLLPEIIGFEQQDGELHFTRPVMQGKLHARVRMRGHGPMVVTVQTGAFEPAQAGSVGAGQVEEHQLDGDRRSQRVLLEVEEVAGDAVDLPMAERIVAVGRGIGDEEKLAVVEKLAAVLGADLGASRPVVDSGWLPRDRQIGSSGHTVAPKLYIAIGISGAIQHLVGMKGSGCIVAINKDRDAPIFSVADYGLVGDLHAFVPALIDALGGSSD